MLVATVNQSENLDALKSEALNKNFELLRIITKLFKIIFSFIKSNINGIISIA